MTVNHNTTKRPNTQFDFTSLGPRTANRKAISEELSVPFSMPKLLENHDLTIAGSPSSRTTRNARVEKPATGSATSESPWEYYDRLFKLRFGDSDYFTVAEGSKIDPNESPVVLVKTFGASKQDDLVSHIQEIQHERFVNVKEFFQEKGICYVFFEFMPLSVAEIMGHPLMTEIRLASILGQVGAQPFLSFTADW
jgi:hypothetical protein